MIFRDRGRGDNDVYCDGRLWNYGRKRCKCCYVDGYKVKEDLEKEDREINR